MLKTGDQLMLIGSQSSDYPKVCTTYAYCEATKEKRPYIVRDVLKNGTVI